MNPCIINPHTKIRKRPVVHTPGHRKPVELKV